MKTRDAFFNDHLMPPKSLQRINLTVLCLFALATLLLYGRAIGFEFLNWDDRAMIVESPIVLAGFDSFDGVFSTEELVRFMPISLIAFKTIYVVFGMDSAYFHAANVLLHLINALLLCSIIRSIAVHRLRASPDQARGKGTAALPFVLILTAFWAWHPLRAETVGWATDLTYHLATLFFLLSSHWLFRYYKTRRWHHAGVSIVAFGLSVTTYPPALTWGVALPFFWILLEEDRDGPLRSLKEWAKSARPSFLPTLGCLLFSLPVLALTLYGRFHESGMWYGGDTVATVGDETTLLERFVHPLHSFAGLIQRMVLPVNLTPAWAPDDPRPISYLALSLLIAFVGWLHLSHCAWARKARLASYVVFLTAVPALGLTEGSFFQPDRVTHLLQAVAVLCFAVVVPADWLALRHSSRGGKRFHGILAACVLLWLPLTSSQLSIWQNTYTLCDHLETVPWVENSRSRSIQVEFIRADKLREDGRFEEAQALFSELMERSSHPQLLYHSALTAAQAGNLGLAETRLLELLSRGPNERAASLLSQIRSLRGE